MRIITGLIFVAAMSVVVADDIPNPAPLPSKSAPLVLKNVQLRQDGSFQGQYLTSEGRSVVGGHLKMMVNGKEHTVVCDASGKFRLRVGTGQCIIHANGEVYACRLWAWQTAPPRAISTVAIIQPGPTVRGQQQGYFPFLPPAPQLTSLGPGARMGLGLGIVTATTIAVVHASQDGS